MARSGIKIRINPLAFFSIYIKKRRLCSYLQVSDGSVEGIVAEAAFLVQEFPGFSIDGWTEQAVIEALLQLLETIAESGSIGGGKNCIPRGGSAAAARHPRSTIYAYATLMQQG